MMKKWTMISVSIIVALVFAGCLSTSIQSKERVDQNLSGNLGYLEGSVPSITRETSPQREFFQLEVDLGSFSKEEKHQMGDTELWGNKGYMVGSLASKTKVSPVELEASDLLLEAAPVREEAPLEMFVYTVKKNETLEDIAARPEIYGNKRRWREIYKANKDKIKNPNLIYPGQTLRIPRK